MQPHKAQVLSRYRELLRLIHRLPSDKATAAKAEAQQTIRQRQTETDPEAQLQYLKELVARISFLRITTPRPVGEKLEGGSYVLRDGSLVKGSGEEKGTRVTDGSMSMDEAKRVNREHYKRFYGKSMPKEMFF
eukprot:GHUV01006768.1.p1 GENE.GHUV01006768.1~~GHUV01006768.1.p1  ORF type:complete len:133 (+),score=26.11 GHUV01006768.1:211-609(+)